MDAVPEPLRDGISIREQVRGLWHSCLPRKGRTGRGEGGALCGGKDDGVEHADDGQEFFLAQGGSSLDALRLVQRILEKVADAERRDALAGRLLESLLYWPMAHFLSLVHDVVREEEQKKKKIEAMRAPGADHIRTCGELAEESGGQGQSVERTLRRDCGNRPEHGMGTRDREVLLDGLRSSAVPRKDSFTETASHPPQEQEGAQGDGAGARSLLQDPFSSKDRPSELGRVVWWRGGTGWGGSEIRWMEPALARRWADAEDDVLRGHTGAGTSPGSAQGDLEGVGDPRHAGRRAPAPQNAAEEEVYEATPLGSPELSPDPSPTCSPRCKYDSAAQSGEPGRDGGGMERLNEKMSVGLALTTAPVWKTALRKCVDASPLIVKYSCGRQVLTDTCP